jgi:hypothetical protein
MDIRGGSKYLAPFILKPWYSFYLRRKGFPYTFNRTLGDPQSRFG